MSDLFYRLTGWARQQISTKVQASTLTALLSSTVLTTLVVWVVGVLVFGGSTSADQVDVTLALVPYPVTGAITGLLTGLSTFVAGYRTTERVKNT